MTVVDEFIARYRREYDFYDQAARLVAQSLDAQLQAAGIRAIVTSRAKSPDRLEPKALDRMKRKHYAKVQDVYDDIVDLAGVRVALYFPAQRAQVDQLINELFFLSEAAKIFPDGTPSKYEKRFAGYSASHYRARLRDTALNVIHKRYAEARVEIQVASVLMHAWAEVEHDLVYKPLQGELSEDEYAILDELNGLVIAGEIALERLQRAGESRVGSKARPFGNHFELAAYLLKSVKPLFRKPVEQSGLGRVDVLFDMISRLSIATPKVLGPYVSSLHPDVERRTISEQIIDQLLAEDESRYAIYEKVKATRRVSPGGESAQEQPIDHDAHEAMGYFLSQWIELERVVRELLPADHNNRTPVPTLQNLIRLGLGPDFAGRFERVRRLRNNVVHGIEKSNSADLREAGDEVQKIVERLLSAKGGPQT